MYKTEKRNKTEKKSRQKWLVQNTHTCKVDARFSLADAAAQGAYRVTSSSGGTSELFTHTHIRTHISPLIIHALKMPQNGGLQSISNGRLNGRRRKEEPYRNWYDEKPNQRTKK